MKKFLLLIMVLGASYITIAQKVIINDPNAEQRTLNGSFNEIRVSDGIDLYLSQYETESIAVSATEAKYKQKIKTEIENNVLKIYYVGDKSWNGWNGSNGKKLKAYVSFKVLEKIQANGASDVRVTGTINGVSLAIKMNGASDFKGDVNVNDLSIFVNGASDVSISGSSKTSTIESNGASDVKGYDLETEICFANASGASDINITVKSEITAKASGASDISYKGPGVLKDQHSTGSSSIKKRG